MSNENVLTPTSPKPLGSGISFKVSKPDALKISAIVKRVVAEKFHPDDAMTISMDITACHANGCPLDLDRLLAAPVADLGHDVLGIRRHISRETGVIGGCFLPRYAAKGGAA